MAEAVQKTFFQNVKPKLIGYIVGAGILQGLVTLAGYPVLFVKVFHGYAALCFMFFILLDLPPMNTQEGIKGAVNLLLTFAIFSGFYTLAGQVHPQFNSDVEIAKINRPPLKLAEVAGPELIAAGKTVFTDNKCYNCHKAAGEGSSDRGPSFDLYQIGLNTDEYLEDNIMDPRKEQSKGFEDAKSKKEMPTYYGDDLDDDELKALLAFLHSLTNDQAMPMRGKAGSRVPWNEDPEMIAQGKKVFEGEVHDELNCSVCHGMDGIPLMEGAADLRNPEHTSKNHKKFLKDFTDAEWFYSVSKGVPDTPMAAWGETFPARSLWLAIAYAQQFHKKKIENEPPRRKEAGRQNLLNQIEMR